MIKILPFLVLGVFPLGMFARQPAKKPLSEKDYAIWKTLNNPKISDSGNLVVYEVNPQKGDGMLVIRHVSGRCDTIPRGKKAEIGQNDEFVVFTIAQPEDTIRKAKVRKVKKEDMPPDSFAIFMIKDHSLRKYARLKSYAVPEENGVMAAFTVSPETKKDTSKTARKVRPVKQPGDNLVLFDSRNTDTIEFHNVTEFTWPKKGGKLYFVQQRKDSLVTRSFLRSFDVTRQQPAELFTSAGFAKKIAAEENGDHYAFLFSKDTAQAKVYSLLGGNNGSAAPVLLADSTTAGLPAGWSPSENGNLYFSKDGSKLFLGTATAPVVEPKDTIPEDEKPGLDVWNWKDTQLQPQQKLEAEKEKKRTYLAVYQLATKKFIQLADKQVPVVNLLQKGNNDTAIGEDMSPYQRASSWTGDPNRDYYLVDVRTGAKRKILTNMERAWISPAGKYIAWYDQGDSCFKVVGTGPEHQEPVSLTRNIPVSFSNELNDLPDFPRPYGIAGWGENDKSLYLYDRYDIWRTDPTGKQPPVCVTRSAGRRNHLQFRYLKTDPEEEYIPSGKTSLLSTFSQELMTAGFSVTDMGKESEPKNLLMTSNSYGIPRKAKKAEVLLWTRESVSDFPDLWTSGPVFENPLRISDANPQQKDYNWLTAEMVEWKSFTGDTLKGLLYKPGNFDPSVKYPMIVYYYERNAEGLYRYPLPKPSQSTINRAFYCSNGYLVFIPDIVYRIGYPGKSAYDAIVSGVYYLAQTRPYLDIAKVGLQGHSWGGYQTAYLVTQTDLFAAAMAGAPVSNMTSAYGGIRWETGVSRMFQYEHTQSRIGGTLWEKPLNYIENSPLFYVPKIHTPLLIMANDNDGAVPWYQGIEFFVALRRLDKPAWMLSYNGEPHNLRPESWANRMDLDKRMFQFFNHFLKGDALPEWMEKGVSAVDKGKKSGY
jgi:dipeptidyl aminopeptidase/acylaminoacyl peptidase